jgi:CubicO group peptidase (beta-lactamase class C family)
MHLIYVGLIAFFALTTASAFSQSQWPTKGWATATPKAVGLIADSLASLDKELSSGKHGNVDAMLIIRNGKIAYEQSYEHDYSVIYANEAKTPTLLNGKHFSGPSNYFNSYWHPYYHNTDLHTMQSVSKTVTSVIIGIAIARKEFPDINSPVLSFFDTSLIKNIDARKRKMTIGHLLTMTAGFDWNENLPYTDSSNTGGMMEASCDWVQYVINRPMAVEPGTVFNYNGGATLILAHIFYVATGKDIEEYATKHLFEPLQIKNFYWKRSPSGLVDTQGGLYMNTRDVAKIFYLYLKNGQWEHNQIVTPDWVQQSVTPRINVAPGLSYGYKWWLLTYDSAQSKTAWAGLGFGGQYPVIIPEYDMIVVFTGWNISPDKPSLDLNFVVKKVLHSVVRRKGTKK